MADHDEDIDETRRKFLKTGACLLGGAAVVAASYPLIKSLSPTENIEHQNAPVRVDISQLHEGEQLTIQWRGKPIWIIRRSQEELKILTKPNPELLDPNSTADQQPAFAQNPYRSLRPDILVLVGICTHLGCIPNFFPQEGSLAPARQGGFLCPCHGSRYDLSGRVFKNMPAPLNLRVPPYHFEDEHTLVVGV
jgi:ubiquinol-cytochrome c reductase iron-sulfur subunit